MKKTNMKIIRFILLDLWVKMLLWLCLGIIMIPYKIIQYGVRAGTKEQREAAKRTR